MDHEEKIKGFLEYLLQKHDTYHHQKENMAHAGILLEVAIFTTIVTFDLGNTEFPILAILIIWIIIHIFIRVQLRLKRSAAINYAGCFRAFREFVNDKDNKLELIPKDFKSYPDNKFVIFLDLFIPIPTSNVGSDTGNTDYPSFISKNIQNQYDVHKTRSSVYEWFLTIISFVMLKIMLIRFI